MASTFSPSHETSVLSGMSCRSSSFSTEEKSACLRSSVCHLIDEALDTFKALPILKIIEKVHTNTHGRWNNKGRSVTWITAGSNMK